MRTIKAVCIRIFHKCARCGAEEKPEEITRMLNSTVTINEENRVTVELLYDNEVKKQ